MIEKAYTRISPYEISGNTFKMIGEDWFLITAGTIDSYNTMTAAWGSFGVLWNKPVVQCFVRPTRHTYNFTEINESFTICFFDEKFRDILNFCGTTSGRNTNKIKETGLIPLITPNNNVYFEQAKLIIECRKIYYQDIIPDNFIDDRIYLEYPAKDYHRSYIGEIIDCFVRK